MVTTDEHTMKFGLLMETAQQHQRLAEESLQKLEGQLQQIDGSIREEVRRVLQGELLTLSSESRQATEALRAVRRAVHLRIALWTLLVTGCCVGGVLGAALWLLPSRTEIESLRTRRDALVLAISELERRGARLDVRPCGDAAQLCVRIDPKAPAYGADGDYRVTRVPRGK
jgi:hypothetical protein